MSDWSPELKERVAALNRMRDGIYADPSTPQGLVSQGQSGSLLDYQIDEQIGDAICAELGHRYIEGNASRFCPRCGMRQHKETGEESKLYKRGW